MGIHFRRLRAPLALTVALLAGACSASDKAKDTALAVDTALNKDLALAGRDTSAQPALNDVASTPTATKPAAKPAAPKATPKPPAATTTASGNTVTKNPSGSASSSAGGAVGTIASGTSLALHSNARVCTNTHTVGQTFSATLADAVSGSNGASIPAGATVNLEITNLKRSENATDKIIMEFAVKSVSFGGRTYPVSATVADAQVDKVRNQPKSKDVQKVVGGAVLGAIAGQIIGKNTKGTVIGAAAGAAAGAGVAAGTANYEGCVPDGGNITVSLTGPLQIKV
ncbi:MAG: hypothetical protein V4550_03945 [Gemmatimonadota bacterium]